MKKMFALVLALLMMLSAAGAMAETCPGHKAITNKTELTDFFLSDGGKACLQKEIDLSGSSGGEGEYHLCLHSNKLRGGFDLEGGMVLHLYDNVGGGELVHDTATVVRVVEGTFVLHSGTVRSEAEGEDAGGTEDGVVQVSPDCTFEMLGGKIEGVSGLVVNYGKTSISGGELTASNGIGVTNYESGRLEIGGDSITASNGMGVMNYGDLEIRGGSIHGDLMGVVMLHGEVEPSLTIKKGEIRNSDKVQPSFPLSAVMTYNDEKGYVPLDEEGCIAEGSQIVKGAFNENYVKVDLISALSGAAGDLPQTGDASMLGAWVCLLGAAGMGLKLKKKH